LGEARRALGPREDADNCRVGAGGGREIVLKIEPLLFVLEAMLSWLPVLLLSDERDMPDDTRGRGLSEIYSSEGE
jgi:hypothetical protein